MSAADLLLEALVEDERSTRQASITLERYWSEEQHHIRLIDWAAAGIGRCPELNGITHVPNGGARVQHVDRKGRRYSPEALRLKLMGTRPGYADLLLDVAAHGKHGLRIELKTLTGELRPDQKAWLVHLRAQDYHADLARGWRDARRLTLEYLTGPLPAYRWEPRDPTKHPLPPLR